MIPRHLVERMLTQLQVLLGGQHRLFVCSDHDPGGESPLVLACLSYPTHVRSLSDRILGISESHTDSV
jgi:hypothetical protein